VIGQIDPRIIIDERVIHMLDHITPELKTEVEQIMADGLAESVRQMVHVAKYGETERARVDAAKYVIDRCLGKVPDKIQIDAMDPIRELLADIMVTDSTAAREAEDRAIGKAKEIREARDRERAHLESTKSND
jgi:hypothetical protein